MAVTLCLLPTLVAALKSGQAGPPPLNAREIARQSKGALLFYWLGERQSYLWAITPEKTSLFTLPAGPEIDALVQRYRQALNGPQDVLDSSEEGRALYRTLVAPAKSLLADNAKVFIIPDGSLNNLNFETLIVAEPKPHFWIEDADVANASSLRGNRAHGLPPRPVATAIWTNSSDRLVLKDGSPAWISNHILSRFWISRSLLIPKRH